MPHVKKIMIRTDFSQFNLSYQWSHLILHDWALYEGNNHKRFGGISCSQFCVILSWLSANVRAGERTFQRYRVLGAKIIPWILPALVAVKILPGRIVVSSPLQGEGESFPCNIYLLKKRQVEVLMFGTQCFVVIFCMSCTLQMGFRESYKKLIGIIQCLLVFRVRSMFLGQVESIGYSEGQKSHSLWIRLVTCSTTQPKRKL